MWNKHKHTYGKWSKPFNSTDVIDSGSFGNTVKVDVVLQDKICKECRLIVAREIRQGKIEDKRGTR